MSDWLMMEESEVDGFKMKLRVNEEEINELTKDVKHLVDQLEQHLKFVQALGQTTTDKTTKNLINGYIGLVFNE